MAQAEYVTSAIRAAITGAGAKPSTSPVLTAYAEFHSRLGEGTAAVNPARSLRCRFPEIASIYLKALLTVLSAYLNAIIDDTAKNVPGGLDLPQIDALLSDLASDVIGTLQNAVERMGWRVA